MTVFVERRGGAIVGLYANLQPGYAEEEIADDHPDVIAFLTPPAHQPDPRDARLARFEAELAELRKEIQTQSGRPA